MCFSGKGLRGWFSFALVRTGRVGSHQGVCVRSKTNESILAHSNSRPAGKNFRERLLGWGEFP